MTAAAPLAQSHDALDGSTQLVAVATADRAVALDARALELLVADVLCAVGHGGGKDFMHGLVLPICS